VTILAIETNDAGIAVAKDLAIVAQSPGYAVLDEDKLLLGEEAERRAQLLPNQTNSRFWETLSPHPLPHPTVSAGTHADLVYAHLGQIWNKLREGADAVILAVPGDYSRAQLELLLGITGKLGIPVRALVDAAVASAQPVPDRATLLNLDIHLHRVVLTCLAQGDELARTQVQVADGVGLADLYGVWAKTIAELFVRETRFDPLHSAQAEQALHDRLPQVLATLASQDTTALEIPATHRTYAVELSRQALIDAAARPWERLRALLTPHTEGDPVAFQIADRLAGLPGALVSVAAAGGTVSRLAPGAGALGALARGDALLQPAGDLTLTMRLPADTSPRPTPRARKAPHPVPTHLLYRGLAYPLGSGPFTLGRVLTDGIPGIVLPTEAPGISRQHCSLSLRDGRLVLEDHSTYGTYVNREKVPGTQVLQVGDRIRLGSEELQAIAVQP